MLSFGFKMKRFKIKTIISMIAMIIAVLSYSTVAVVLYQSSTGFLKEKITSASFSNLSQISKKIEMSLSEIENLTKRITTSHVLHDLLLQYDQRKHIPFDNRNLSREISSFLNNAKEYADGVDSVLILMTDDHFYVSENDNKDHEHIDYDTLLMVAHFNQLISNPQRPSLIHLNEDVLHHQNELTSKDNILTKGSTLFTSAIKLDDQVNAIVVIKINEDWIKGILDEKYQVAILNGKDVLWKGTQIDLPFVEENFPDVVGNEGMLGETGTGKERVIYKKLSWDDWYLFYFENLESSTNRLKIIGTLILIFFVISVLTSFAISRLTLKRVIEPLNQLSDNVRRYKNNDEQDPDFSIKKDKYSMRDRILVYFLSVILVPLSLFIGAYFIFSQKIIREELIYAEATAFHQTTENISLFIENKLKAISSMNYDRTIQDAMVTEPDELNPDMLYEVVNGYMLLTNGYDDITFYNIHQERILSTYNNNHEYQNEIDSLPNNNDKKIKWLPVRKDALGRNILGIAIEVTGSNLDTSYHQYLLKNIGYIFLRLDESDLEQIYRDIYVKSNASVHMIDASSTIISSVDESRIGLPYQQLKDVPENRSNSLIFNEAIDGTPWFLTAEYDYQEIYDDFMRILHYSGFFLLVIVLFLVIASYEIAFRIANSITRFNHILSDTKADMSLEYFPSNSRISEVYELAVTFNEMVTRIDTLIDDLILSKNKQNRLETEKKDAEILALQSQIQPHFLCNTLESIRCLVKEKKETAATEMLKDLSDLFRYGISKVENLIDIRQELSHAAAYTRIMKKRFENIQFDFEIDEAVNDYQTPKMVLQPIIENAIYHGLAPRKSQGSIKISCREEEETILFSVADDGVGMDSNALIQLKDRLLQSHSNRIGLENVQKRLKLYFGEKADIQIDSDTKGTTVKLTIPKLLADGSVYSS